MIGLEAIQDRLSRVHEKIDDACRKAGREDEKVVLVAVTKTFPVEYLEAAIRYGATDIGESKVQEFEAKRPKLQGNARWHLIGHLQKNKINKALKLFDMIQSVDSYDLAKEISKRAERSIEILIQINSTGEDSKFGLNPSRAQEDILKISELESIAVKGIMTIGPFVENEKLIRESFVLTRNIYEELKRFENDKLKMQHLSMGMSNDFELAVLEGANMLRVGSSIFGARG